MVFDSTDENKDLLKKYNDVFNGIKNKIKKISDDEFNSDDDVPLNKALKFYNITITIRSVFKKDGKLYP